MKNALVLTSLLFSILAYSQRTTTVNPSSTSPNTLSFSIDPFGYTAKLFEGTDIVKGSNYLFERWENNCTVISTEGKMLRFRNINFNLERQVFESLMKQDSLFSFSFRKIDRFIINGRTFKNYQWKDKNHVCEILFQSNDFDLIKKYKVLFVPATSDTMVKRIHDKYTVTETYYRVEGANVKQIKLNKKQVLNLFDHSKRKKIEDYVIQQNLSYKQEHDVLKILRFAGLN